MQPETNQTNLQKNSESSAPQKKSSKLALALAFAIFAFFLSGASLTVSILNYQKETPQLTINPSGTDGNSANFTEGSIADVANRVSNSVVSITTEIRTTGWFGQSSTSSAAGTGIIISSDGYILTNKHVIEGANKISIVTADGTIYEKVKLVTTDPLNDIAFLKISDASDLSFATLGDSKTISVGQQVIAIGNALGQFENTITSGIISGTGRSIVATDSSYSSSESLVDMIQTDAAINPGNSGGPLVNAAGEVIGINTATSSDADGIGFAIPISSVKGMIEQLLDSGEAERAYLGVYSINITPDVVAEYELPVSTGAYLYREASGKYNSSAIAKDSPAEEAGLKNKDIITSINGTAVGSSGSLTTLIGEYKPGDTIQLSILREGKEMTLNVTLGSYED